MDGCGWLREREAEESILPTRFKFRRVLEAIKRLTKKGASIILTERADISSLSTKINCGYQIG